MISAEMTVREIATLFPDAARLLDRAGIDYSCTTTATLADACSAAGADSAALLSQIEELRDSARPSESGKDWSRETIGHLISYILDTHHTYLREELPRLERLMNKVYETHGKTHGELLKVHEIFFALRNELELHLHKEEVLLFPYLTAMERAWQEDLPSPACPFGSVRNPIRVMVKEHASAEDLLEAIRANTSDFTPPVGACLGFTLLLHGLCRLEADLREHIRLENELLFSKAVQVERATA